MPIVYANKIDFNQDIRPILSDRCFHCHGPDEHDRKKKLRLDIADGHDGAYRERKGKFGIKPGDPEKSEVWLRIISGSEDDVMPPPDAGKKELTEKEKALIKQWIEEGAEYMDFWAFVPAKKPDAPKVNQKDWSKQMIDLLTLKKMEEAKLNPSEEADKRTLIRRLTFDLTGLPPTREEIATFLADKSENAYEKLVDRLVKSQRYGEHMARYWLDLVRFADTNGMHHDHYRDMTPYRDWVINSFNQNQPYSEFLKEQIAGDLIPNASREQLVASGFNRLHLIIDAGTAPPKESYTRNVVDRVTAVGTAFMGLTVQCAMCHDHKYDPIKQKDFYALFAFFNNIDAGPETGGRGGLDFKLGLQKPYILLSTSEQEKDLKSLDQKIAAYRKEQGELNKKAKQEQNKIKKLNAENKKNGINEVVKIDPALKKKYDAEKKRIGGELKKLSSKKEALLKVIPAAMVMKERKDVRPAYNLIRGAYDNEGKVVKRNTPEFLFPMKKKEGLKTRLDLADWFLDSKNPLTARVAVNRFWQQFLGVGIVKTSEDIGAQGEVPTHPKLLDYLTIRFVESGWNVKSLVKEIVMSKTYRQSSNASNTQYKKDPENRYLARGSRYRMDSEMIRDQILATSGQLVLKMGGRSVKPPQPDGLWKSVTMPFSYPKTFTADTGDKIFRRSVYTFWKRGLPPPQMSIFNAPSRESCIARRERTNTPLQALLLMNETEYMKAATKIASDILKENLSDAQGLNTIYEMLTSQIPDTEEKKTLLDLLSQLKLSYQTNPNLATELCGSYKRTDPQENIKLASWTMLVNTIYNLDITKTRE